MPKRAPPRPRQRGRPGAPGRTLEPVPRPPVARITPAELARRLHCEEPITLLDVRGRSYRTSDRKIEGAVRIDPRELAERYEALPHDATIVAYCT